MNVTRPLNGIKCTFKKISYVIAILVMTFSSASLYARDGIHLLKIHSFKAVETSSGTSDFTDLLATMVGGVVVDAAYIGGVVATGGALPITQESAEAAFSIGGAAGVLVEKAIADGSPDDLQVWVGQFIPEKIYPTHDKSHQIKPGQTIDFDKINDAFRTVNKTLPSGVKIPLIPNHIAFLKDLPAHVFLQEYDSGSGNDDLGGIAFNGEKSVSFDSKPISSSEEGSTYLIKYSIIKNGGEFCQLNPIGQQMYNKEYKKNLKC